MNESFNIYCDESCHLENDGIRPMVLGAIWCMTNHRKRLARRIKALKKEHGVAAGFEIKWVKVSPARIDLYKKLLDLFFDEKALRFRGLVVPDKMSLNHARFSQDHDDFYYKQWYTLLNKLIHRDNRYQIFIDIKDTQGARKLAKLHDVLCNANYDFDRGVIEKIEQVHSHDVPLLQLADLLIGAISYANRGLKSSSAKIALVEHLQRRSVLSLDRSSTWSAEKFNLFIWRPQR